MFLPPEPQCQKSHPVIFIFFWDAGQVPRPIVPLLMLNDGRGAARDRKKNFVIRNRSLAKIATRPILLCFCLFFPCINSGAQTTSAFSDPQIKTALSEISAGQIEADIEKLVSFQNRSTISAQDASSIAAGKGIGAAREWIKA